MTYLSPPEYESYGLDATTPSSLVTAASAILDAHCRRDTLSPAQYQERIRTRPDRNTLRLTYLPLVPIPPATSPIITLRARYAPPRRGDCPWTDFQSAVTDVGLSVAYYFGLSSSWADFNSSDVDLYAATGELTLPTNALGLGFSEVEVTYTAGVDPLTDGIKAACAQIVRNAQATPALNVRQGRIDRMYLEYFSDQLVDETVRSLLAPYVAQKLG